MTPVKARGELATRVQRGVEFLDEFRPQWREEIDRSRLDLDSCDDCILGQLYGSFRDGLETVGLSVSVSRALGFNYEARSNLGWLTHYGYDGVAARVAEVEEAETLRELWLEKLAR